jgi:hypothetical protein
MVEQVTSDKGAVMIDVVNSHGKLQQSVLTERIVDSSSDGASVISEPDNASNQSTFSPMFSR